MIKASSFGGLALLALTACTSLPKITDRPPLELAFAPKANGFDVSLANPSAYERCVESESWPNAAGWIHFASDVVFAEVDGDRFSLRERNVGYCFGGCQVVRIPPNGRVSAQLPYGEFPGLASPAPHNAKLTLRPTETPCKR